MEIKQGDIYWISIPRGHIEGSEQYGRKPFVVMSRDAINRVLKTVLVIPLSTHQGQTSDPAFLAAQPPYRIVIPAPEITRDPSCNMTLYVSIAKTDQARVVDKTRLQDKIGRLSQTAVISVGVGLAYVFDIR